MKSSLLMALGVGLFTFSGQQEPPLMPYGDQTATFIQWVWQQGGLAVAIAILLTVLRRDSQAHATELKTIKDEHTQEIKSMNERHTGQIKEMASEVMATLRENSLAFKEFGVAVGKLSTAVNVLSIRVTKKPLED